jgi:gliding motility-associated-like protein
VWRLFPNFGSASFFIPLSIHIKANLYFLQFIGVFLFSETAQSANFKTITTARAMKMLCFLLFFILFLNLPQQLSAQENLFPNPSFEQFDTCINAQSKDTNRLSRAWSHPTEDGIVPDSIRCNEDFWLPYITANLEARTGKAVQYFVTYYSDDRATIADFRSYIVTKLKKPLVKDFKYFLKIYTRCIFNSNLGGFGKTNGQAVAFTQKYPADAPGGLGALNLKPTIQYEKVVDTAVWTEISGCFTANGGEKYAVFGNFKRKDSTIVKNLGPKDAFTFLTIGSYIIDDVSLTPLNMDFPSDTAICQGDTLILDLKTPFPATYKWQDGSTAQQYRVTKGGTYSFTISYDIQGTKCTTYQEVYVNMLPRYKPLKMVDTIICYDKSILLKTGTGRKDDTIIWSDNSRKDTLRVEKTGLYTATITNACGRYVEDYKVNFINCAINIYVPNAFSPNGDNQNETFSPFINSEFPILEYEFAVYNRWGNKVFASTDKTAAWDGQFNGKQLQPDVYIWTLKLIANVGGRRVLKEEAGDVNLLR